MPRLNGGNCTSQGQLDKKKTKIMVDEVHQKLGHCGEGTTRPIAKELGIELYPDPMKPCAAFEVAKTKQKNIPKTQGSHEIA